MSSANEQKNLNETERDSGQGRVPRKGNAGGIDRADGEKDKRGHAQQRRDNRDEFRVELESAEEPPDRRCFAPALATIIPAANSATKATIPRNEMW